MQAMKSVRLTSTADSRFIRFSDAHRGDGTGADDFAANSLIFKTRRGMLNNAQIVSAESLHLKALTCYRS